MFKNIDLVVQGILFIIKFAPRLSVGRLKSITFVYIEAD